MKERINFYDTNELLHNLDSIKDTIYLSSVTLQELEHIKTSKNKDEDIKYEARKVTRFLRENEEKYVCIPVENKHHKLLSKYKLEEDNDNLIIACAKLLEKEYDVTFYTDDICCYNIAKNIFNLNCKGLETNNKKEEYKGYKEVIMSDEELSNFYENGYNDNIYDLLINEYLIIKDSLNNPIDSWKFTKEGLIRVETKFIESNQFGKTTPKDFYQKCLMDSFKSNVITCVKGKAGSGKSYLAMNYLFNQLERGKIDKIIIFVNPIAVRGSGKLGFYPGDKNEKLLDSTIGNFLCGKLGDISLALDLIAKGQLMLIPIADIRGMDLTGMNAGLYITEAQNLSIDLMKLSLQRIGEDCICIIDGDCDTQVDDRLFEGSNNGMKRMSEIFRGQDLYGEVELKNIYRSRIGRIADKM